MADNNRRQTQAENFSRRQWLQAMGVSSAVTLAGCMGGDDGNGNGNGNGGNGNGNGNGGNGNGNGNSGNGNGNGDGDAQRWNYMRGGTHFPDLQWNPFAENYNSSIALWTDFLPVWIREADNVPEPWGLTEFNYDPDTRVMELELRDDLLFWNGDQYTTEDWYAFQEMSRLQNPEGSNYEQIEIIDETNIEFTTKEAINPEIAYLNDIPTYLNAGGTDVWQEWLERYQDASDQEARDEITNDLIEMQIETEEFVDEGWGVGLYIINEVTDEYIDFVAFEDHPFWQGAADEKWGLDPNIENVRMWYADETGVEEQMLVNERVDVSVWGNEWEAFEDQLPDYWERFQHGASTNGYKIIINGRSNEYLQDVNFRRAMAAALHFENHANNTGTFPAEVQSGLPETYNEQYWGGHPPDQLIDYGTTTEEELADEYLNKAGVERDGDTMFDEDGNELDEMQFVIGGRAWGSVGQSAANQLQQFGFPLNIQEVGRTNKLDIVTEDMGEWDLSTEGHSGAHASDYFTPEAFSGWRIGPGDWGPAPEWEDQVQQWLDEDRTHSPFNGKPMVFEIPQEVGQEDLSGETQQINLVELYNEALSPVSEERTEEIIQTLSWAWNFLLPDIDVTFASNESFGNAQKMEFGDEEGFANYHGMYWPVTGYMRLRE